MTVSLKIVEFPMFQRTHARFPTLPLCTNRVVKSKIFVTPHFFCWNGFYYVGIDLLSEGSTSELKIGASGGLKRAKNDQFSWFSTPYTFWESFFGWILASKAYIHYGPWPLCPDEPLKGLFMASGSLKKAQNRPQSCQFSWFWTPYTFLESFFGWTMEDPCL